MNPNIDRRWIYNLAHRVVHGKNLTWGIEKILKEAQETEFKEHPQVYREWMGKQIVFR
jgi:hypothetical protein